LVWVGLVWFDDDDDDDASLEFLEDMQGVLR